MGIDNLLSLRGVSKYFSGKQILQDISLTVNAGEVVTLIGPNGAGKSTLAKVAVGLVKPDKGTIELKPGLILGYMPQHLHIEPGVPVSVLRFVKMAGSVGPSVGKAQALAALAETGAEQLAEHRLWTLSGGELQRVLLARALVRLPDLLVLDEPVQGVDITGQLSLYQLVNEVRIERGCGVLMVSHDLHLVMSTTDKVFCINHHICCSGPPQDVSRHPNFQALFPSRDLQGLALYTHHHNHRHTESGEIIDGGKQTKIKRGEKDNGQQVNG